MNPCRTLSPPISRSHSQTLHFPCASPEVNGQTGPPGCNHIHPDCPTGDYPPTELHPRSLTLPNVCLPTSYLASLPVTRRNLSHIKSQPCSLYTTHCVLPSGFSFGAQSQLATAILSPSTLAQLLRPRIRCLLPRRFQLATLPLAWGFRAHNPWQVNTSPSLHL